MIILSAVITFFVLFLLLFGGLFFRKKKKQAFERLMESMDYFAFCIFVFLALTLYIIVLMINSDINDLYAAVLLVIFIIGACKVASVCVKDVVLSDETIKERELLVFAAIIALAGIFGVLGYIENEKLFFDYMHQVLAIGFGFFVSLGVLVKKIPLGKQIKELVKGYGRKQLRIVLGPVLWFFVIICVVFIFSENVTKVSQDMIYYGIGIGSGIFVLSIILIFKNKKTWKFIEKFFFESSKGTV